MPDRQTSGFKSPLLIDVRTEFTGVSFGRVEMSDGVARLRSRLNELLFEITDELPLSLGAEARSTLSGYSGGDRDFFRLFYVPIWSFLYWVPAAHAEPRDAELLRSAQTAHALSLFLHLWDDHLCDKQLPVDLLRLQVRTLAWQHYSSAGEQLCRQTGADHRLLSEHAGEYLVSLHHPTPASDVDEYCRRFARQVAIWTLVPRLLGQHAGGPSAGAQLCRIIESFAIAWRLLDDVQDIHEDMLKGEASAVWLELDDEGRRRWTACRDHSTARGELDAETWASLAEAVRETGCLARLLARIDEELTGAARAAASSGWNGIARELEQCREGIDSARAGTR